MREKTLGIIALTILFLTFAVASVPVKATVGLDHVRVYIWNPVNNSNRYDFQTGTTTNTYVQVWIDSPAEWENTAMGIVGVKICLQVDPAVVTIVKGVQDVSTPGFLAEFLMWYGYDIEGPGGVPYSTLFLPGTVDNTLGQIIGTGEIIGTYTDLGVGAGNGLSTNNAGWVLYSIQIRTKAGYPRSYSLLTLFNCEYTTVDGFSHPVTDLVNGEYGIVVPEFPLGLAPIIMLAPLIPIVYLWRKRPKKRV